MNKYQDEAMSTCMDSCDNYSYMMLNLVGEVGELASKIAKDIRKRNALIEGNELFYPIEPSQFGLRNKELMLEAGDILWQLAGLCNVMCWSLEEVAQANLDKLQARKQAGTISGDGDGIYKR